MSQINRRGNEIIGIDNHNSYYDPSIKELRLKRYIDRSNYFHNLMRPKCC